MIDMTSVRSLNSLVDLVSYATKGVNDVIKGFYDR